LGSRQLAACRGARRRGAEADGRGYPEDEARFLLIARGSLNETRHWLTLAAKADLLREDDYAEQLDELGRTLNGVVRRRRP
jgi:four helix bundle protein